MSESLLDIIDIIEAIQAQLAAGATHINLRVLDPDHGQGRFAGEPVEYDGRVHVHRPLRVWFDLAERLQLRLRTPKPTPDGYVQLCFERLDHTLSWHRDRPDRTTEDTSEKYGVGSGFSRVSKLEDPGFVLDLADALTRAKLGPTPRVLDVGCNDADVLTLIQRLLQPKQPSVVGLDHSHSAITRARERLPDPAHRFVEADVNDLPKLELGRFDLVLALSTLHSPGVDDRAVLRHIVRELLEPGGTIIIGVPNCRYMDGELLHGARTKNFSQPELGLMIKSVASYKRYLQQHRRRVYVTGKHYVLVTGAPD